MNHVTKNEKSRIDVAVALAMLFFAVPKLVGAGTSVEGFTIIGQYVGVDPTAARLTTGVIELAIATALLLGFGSAVFNKHAGRFSPARLSAVAHLGLLGTMFGATFTELAIRPGDSPGLLALAVALIAVAIYRLNALRPHAISQSATLPA